MPDALPKAVAGVESVELDRLIRSLSRICATRRDPRARAMAAQEAVALAVSTHDWLPGWCRVTDTAGYRPHLLYVAPDGAFSIVAMAWLPGQRTSIHDHVTWGVVGVYRGRELSTGYGLHSDAGRPVLVTRGCDEMLPGDTATLVPPDEDIHQVRCTADSPSVSVHVYGADIARLGSSINRRFDDLPVATGVDLRPASWRATSLGNHGRIVAGSVPAV